MMGPSPAEKPPAAIRRGRADPGRTNGDGTMGLRLIVTTGLAALYVAGCLAALALLLGMWSPSL